MDVTPLHRYYGPIRLPSKRSAWLLIPTGTCRTGRRLGRASPLCRQFFPRAPLLSTPTSSQGAYVRFFPWDAGFTKFGRLATSVLALRGLQGLPLSGLGLAG